MIFARFARPRGSLLFSEVAILGRYERREALKIRVASTRARPLADAHAQLVWARRTELPGQGLRRNFVDLPLLQANDPLLGLTWTLIHVPDQGSDLVRALREEKGPVDLIVTVSGTDTLLATPQIESWSYTRSQVLVDHEFADIISEQAGIPQVDLTDFHVARPLGGT